VAEEVIEMRKFAIV